MWFLTTTWSPIQGKISDLHDKKEVIPFRAPRKNKFYQVDYAHASGWLFLVRFQSFDQWKFTPLNNVVLAGDFLAITTLTRWNLTNFENNPIQQEVSDISNTSCVASNFSKVVHSLHFSKNNFPLLKARPNSFIFSLSTLFFHFKHRWFFSPIILNERALEPTFNAAGQ